MEEVVGSIPTRSTNSLSQAALDTPAAWVDVTIYALPPLVKASTASSSVGKSRKNGSNFVI